MPRAPLRRDSDSGLHLRSGQANGLLLRLARPSARSTLWPPNLGRCELLRVCQAARPGPASPRTGSPRPTDSYRRQVRLWHLPMHACFRTERPGSRGPHSTIEHPRNNRCRVSPGGGGQVPRAFEGQRSIMLGITIGTIPPETSCSMARSASHDCRKPEVSYRNDAVGAKTSMSPVQPSRSSR